MSEKNKSENFEIFSCIIIEKRQISAGLLIIRLRCYWRRVADDSIIIGISVRI